MLQLSMHIALSIINFGVGELWTNGLEFGLKIGLGFELKLFYVMTTTCNWTKT